MPWIQSKKDAKEDLKKDPCVGRKGCVGENLCVFNLKGPVAQHPQFLDTTADQRE